MQGDGRGGRTDTLGATLATASQRLLRGLRSHQLDLDPRP